MRRPLVIARQSGHPRGLLGRAIAAIMVHETAAINRTVIAAMMVQPGDHILDIGCGSGLSIALLAPLVPNGSVSGIDPSAVMIDRARARNCKQIAAERAMVMVASVEQLPFIENTFDAVMSVHTLYFWADINFALAEIARVMRSNGRLVLAFRTGANPAAIASFPGEVYNFRSMAEITDAAAQAGFVDCDTTPDGPNGEPALLVARKQG
jgi:ubiquinone/menaquinone biosynthesis C-methylase UbiE